jgi:hypothetical protein
MSHSRKDWSGELTRKEADKSNEMQERTVQQHVKQKKQWKGERKTNCMQCCISLALSTNVQQKPTSKETAGEVKSNKHVQAQRNTETAAPHVRLQTGNNNDEEQQRGQDSIKRKEKSAEWTRARGGKKTTRREGEERRGEQKRKRMRI